MVLTPHLVRRHASGPFAGRPEHFFPAHGAKGAYELRDPKADQRRALEREHILVPSVSLALDLVRRYRFDLRMRGDLTDDERFVAADEIDCL